MAAESQKFSDASVTKIFFIFLLALVISRFAGDAVQSYFDRRAVTA